MEYKRFGNKIIVRIDKDEEILEQVKKLALKENIRLAAVQALGATNSFTVGVYNVVEKQYYANSFSGSFEIVSLTGTINTMNGEFYTHLHMSAGNDKGEELNDVLAAYGAQLDSTLSSSAMSKLPASKIVNDTSANSANS